MVEPEAKELLAYWRAQGRGKPAVQTHYEPLKMVEEWLGAGVPAVVVQQFMDKALDLEPWPGSSEKARWTYLAKCVSNHQAQRPGSVVETPPDRFHPWFLQSLGLSSAAAPDRALLAERVLAAGGFTGHFTTATLAWAGGLGHALDAACCRETPTIERLTSASDHLGFVEAAIVVEDLGLVDAVSTSSTSLRQALHEQLWTAVERCRDGVSSAIAASDLEPEPEGCRPSYCRHMLPSAERVLPSTTR